MPCQRHRHGDATSAPLCLFGECHRNKTFSCRYVWCVPLHCTGFVPQHGVLHYNICRWCSAHTAFHRGHEYPPQIMWCHRATEQLLNSNNFTKPGLPWHKVRLWQTKQQLYTGVLGQSTIVSCLWTGFFQGWWFASLFLATGVTGQDPEPLSPKEGSLYYYLLPLLEAEPLST